MKKILILLIFIFILSKVFSGDTENISNTNETLTLKHIVGLVLKNNPEVKASLDLVNYYLYNYKSTKADKFPQFGITSGYGTEYTSEREYTPYKFENEFTHTVFCDLNVAQLLPSCGQVTFGVDDTLTIRSFSELSDLLESPIISQTPSVYIRLDQPIFFNGKFIDSEVYYSTFRKSEAAYLSAFEGYNLTKNAVVYNTMALVFDVISLRNIIKKQENSIKIRNESLDRLERNLAQGIIPETDIWEMRTEIGKERELMLKTIYLLNNKENDLRQTIGFPKDQEIIFDENILTNISIDEDIDLDIDEILNKSKQIKIKELDYEIRKHDTVLNSSGGASVWNTSLSISPRYPEIRKDQQNFYNSFSDFSAFNINLNITVDIDIYSAAKWNEQRKADLLYEKIAKDALNLEKEKILNNIDSLLRNKKNLEMSIVLLEDNIKLKEKQVSMEKKLLKVGQSTELDVVEIEIEYLDKLIELKDTKMASFLNQLNILSLTGKDLGDFILLDM